MSRGRDEWPVLDHDGERPGPRLARPWAGDGRRRRGGRRPPGPGFGARGITRLSVFHIAHDIAAGRLDPGAGGGVQSRRRPETISAVYVGHAGPLPARVRAFIVFLAAEADVDLADRGGSPGAPPFAGAQAPAASPRRSAPRVQGRALAQVVADHE
ncbi:hypothetical protein ACRAWD_24230 [Caulobacter segnis]